MSWFQSIPLCFAVAPSLKLSSEVYHLYVAATSQIVARDGAHCHLIRRAASKHPYLNRAPRKVSVRVAEFLLTQSYQVSNGNFAIIQVASTLRKVVAATARVGEKAVAIIQVFSTLPSVLLL